MSKEPTPGQWRYPKNPAHARTYDDYYDDIVAIKERVNKERDRIETLEKKLQKLSHEKFGKELSSIRRQLTSITRYYWAPKRDRILD